jgi:hypothetical protein
MLRFQEGLLVAKRVKTVPKTQPHSVERTFQIFYCNFYLKLCSTNFSQNFCFSVRWETSLEQNIRFLFICGRVLRVLGFHPFLLGRLRSHRLFLGPPGLCPFFLWSLKIVLLTKKFSWKVLSNKLNMLLPRGCLDFKAGVFSFPPLDLLLSPTSPDNSFVPLVSDSFILRTCSGTLLSIW